MNITATIPHSREAEESVLASVFISPELLPTVAYLKGDRFYVHRNKWIWDVFVALREKGIEIDVVTVADELARRGQLDEIGGSAYLTALISRSPNSWNIESHARLVHDYWVKRETIKFANDIAKASYNGKTGDDVLEIARSGLGAIERGNGVFSGESIRSRASKIYDRVSDGQAAVKFIPSGLAKLDALLYGWHQRKLYYISARPKQGKSSFLLQTARHAAEKYKQRVGVFSLEMDEDEMTARLIQQQTGIDSRRLLRGALEEREWVSFTRQVECLSDLAIDLHFVPALTISQLRARATAGNYDLVIVDYINLMVSEKRTENRVQEVAYISRNLKVLAGELNVPVLAATQMNREVEKRADKRPVLSDLKESGSLEQDGDAVLFIYGKDEIKADNPERKIEIAAQRSGPTGIQTVYFHDHRTLFSDEVVIHE